LEASLNSNQNNDVSFNAHHHSSAQIEIQYVSQISHPPPILHDPIDQYLEESYLARSVVKYNFSSFFMFT
ncbi:hypothetical protein, partial [Actinobacillus pleuropneumoniae]